MSLKRITFLTGTRADFGKMLALMRVVDATPQFDCEIVVTGMHMMSKFGYTYNEVVKAGFRSIFPIFNQSASISQKMDLALATTITLFSHYVSERRPDLIVIHGDRIEALAAVIVGSLNNVKVAHIEGGEVSGTIDESLRHSISKLASVHLVSNDTARQRLLQLGERETSVFVIGSPEVDVMVNEGLPNISEVRARYDIPFTSYAILIYHPVVSEIDHIANKISEVLSAAVASGFNFVVIRPNNDLGSDLINAEIDKILELDQFKVLPSMRFEYYLALLRGAQFILGNSSSGIREAPVYGVPSVNVGTRQSGRYQYEGILNSSEDRSTIISTIEKLPERVTAIRPFGDGRTAERFLDILKSDLIWLAPQQKSFVDRTFS